MPAATSRLALPYPIPDDSVDVPRDVQALAAKLDPIKNLGVPLVTVLPATAVEGDEVYFDANPGQGVIWHLRYDASIGDGNKWEFLGGPPIQADVVAPSTTNSTTYADLAAGPGPSVVAPLKGVYNIDHGAQLYVVERRGQHRLSGVRGGGVGHRAKRRHVSAHRRERRDEHVGHRGSRTASAHHRRGRHGRHEVPLVVDQSWGDHRQLPLDSHLAGAGRPVSQQRKDSHT
jgi:hypothetical protein